MMHCIRAGLALAALVLASCAHEPPPQAAREVTLIRDDWGVPHIFAESEEAGFFALGYAMAEDRLHRLLGLVLFARGEMASRLGPKTLDADIRSRLWRHRDMALLGVAQLSPELKRNYEAFLEGIRAYAAESGVKPELAAAANALDVADLIAVVRAALYAGYQMQAALAECGVDGMAYSKGFLPYKANVEGRASNGWVVMPQRTADGALILGADPHVENDSGAYYEFHIDAGDLHSSGFALGPLLWQTHTESVAWAMTTGNPDYIDCYAIETRDGVPDTYVYGNEVRSIETRRETFLVAGGAPETRNLEYVQVNGLLAPVVARKGRTIYAAVAADMDRAGYLHEEIYRMNLAADVAGVKAALATMSMLPQNLIVGDAKGRVLYVRAGRVPVRPEGFDWSKPVSGNTPASAWKGYRRLDELVQIADPPAGYLQNNNVAPDTMAPGFEDLVARYAPDVFFDAPGRRTTRGVRASVVLAGHPRMTLDDAMALAFDETWVSAPQWTGALRVALARFPDLAPEPDGEAANAVARLLTFDGVASAESEAAADLFFWHLVAQNSLAALKDRWFVEQPWEETRLTRPFATALLKALKTSVDERLKRYGTARQRLGDVMRIGKGDIDHPVGGVSLESSFAAPCLELARPVCDRTMRAFGITPIGETGRFRVVRGSQAMRIVQFTNPIRAFSLYAFGASDDPEGPHFADQARLISEKRMKPAYFSRAELEGHIASEKTLSLPPQRP